MAVPTLKGNTGAGGDEVGDQGLVDAGAADVAAGAAGAGGVDDREPLQRIVGEGDYGLNCPGRRVGQRGQQILRRVGVGIGAVAGEVALGVVAQRRDPAGDLVEPVGGGRRRARAVARPGISVVGTGVARDLRASSNTHTELRRCRFAYARSKIKLRSAHQSNPARHHHRLQTLAERAYQDRDYPTAR
jgi:hypothetical protein